IGPPFPSTGPLEPSGRQLHTQSAPKFPRTDDASKCSLTRKSGRHLPCSPARSLALATPSVTPCFHRVAQPPRCTARARNSIKKFLRLRSRQLVASLKA